MGQDRYSYIQVLEKGLSEDERLMLRSIYAPTIVGVPPEDARKCLCVMADGEIRAYGCAEETAANPQGVPVYLSSRDCGLSWKKCYQHGAMEAARFFPEAGRYISVLPDRQQGMSVALSDIGPGDPAPRIIHINDEPYYDCFQPVQSAFSSRIWFTGQRVRDGLHSGHWAGFFYSDDFGETWKVSRVPSIPDMPVTYPDKGYRWNNCGCEPYAEELDEHTMMMILRNNRDEFYLSYSYDRGETWSNPEPSDFYGHATTSFLLRLTDGRTLIFWNNNQMLPEQKHETQTPVQDPTIIDGTWEDVFTNRDAAHAAITEDGGKSWIGYREVFLNPARNRADFRKAGIRFEGEDKSVHQFQALELPFGKILLCVGQSPVSRRLLIFDVKWLYENSVEEDFCAGLENVTTHLYYRSITGNASDTDKGHCAWNRVSGAVMAQNPDGEISECVHVGYVEDERLLTGTQGVVWNFPMSRLGEVQADVEIKSDILRVCLSDRWYNCCDETVTDNVPYHFDLDARDLGSGFVTLRVVYNADEPFAQVYAGDKLLFRIPRHREIRTGISYLVLQCVARRNSEGFYLKRLSKH